jgi:predicted house-cleaning noncanonical NTP pyrophosphatase (MazG superfamily)
MKIDENLSETFDIEPMPKGTQEIITQDGEVIKEPNARIEKDYEDSRENLKNLLEKGQEALLHSLEVAKQSEHPRAFEVVGNLIKQLADVNQQLMDLHQQKQKLDAPKASKGDKNVTNNAIFVGSTAELNKLIHKMNKGD